MPKYKIDKVQAVARISRDRIGSIPGRLVFVPKPLRKPKHKKRDLNQD